MPLLDFRNCDFSEVQVSFLGNTFVTGIKTIEYSVKQEKTPVYGAASNPLGMGRGIKEYSGKISIHLYDVVKMKEAAGVKEAVDIPAFDINAKFGNGSNPLQVATLKGCDFSEESLSISSGDTEILIEMPFMFLSIT